MLRIENKMPRIDKVPGGRFQRIARFLASSFGLLLFIIVIGAGTDTFGQKRGDASPLEPRAPREPVAPREPRTPREPPAPREPRITVEPRTFNDDTGTVRGGGFTLRLHF